MPTSSTTAPTLLAGEVQKPHRRGDLEESRSPLRMARVVVLELLDGLPHVVDQRRRSSPIVAGLPSIKNRSSSPCRCGEQYKPVRTPEAVERRRQHRRRRSFPLGSRDVDDLQAKVGITQSAQQAPHPAQPQLPRGPGHAPPLVVQPAVEVVESLLIVISHGGSVVLDPCGSRPLTWCLDAGRD